MCIHGQTARSGGIRAVAGFVGADNGGLHASKLPSRPQRGQLHLMAAAPNRTTDYLIGTAGRFQISRAYSRMVRSLENLPTRAVLRMAILAQVEEFR
jgi:hypothetical protein